MSNLAWMMDHQDVSDNHNAPVFVWCYKRMGEFVRQLLGEGRQPRVMLDYSGTLLHGMRQMGLNDVFDQRQLDQQHLMGARVRQRAQAHGACELTFQRAPARSRRAGQRPRCRRALFYLLTCEESDVRYWGQGAWTDYGAELARRGAEAARSGT